MKVYVVLYENKEDNVLTVDVFRTKEDATFRMNDVANTILEHDEELYEIYRLEGSFVSIGYDDPEGYTTCTNRISIFEKLVGHYSKKDKEEP